MSATTYVAPSVCIGSFPTPFINWQYTDATSDSRAIRSLSPGIPACNLCKCRRTMNDTSNTHAGTGLIEIIKVLFCCVS